MPRQPLDLAPFRGLRYVAPDVDRFIDGGFDLARLLAPPYDIPDAEEARELQRSDPHNAARVTLPFELSRQAPQGGDTASRRYRAAADLLRDWIDEGVLALDEAPALYVYEQTAADGRVQRGLVGALGLPEQGPEAGVPAVRPHEDVADPPVRDRFRLMEVARANLEPIFLVYRGAGGAASAATEATGSRDTPLVSARTRDGARHSLWAITDPELQREVSADLAARSALIADGHHRYAAYLRLRRENTDPGWSHGLALLVDSDTHPPRLGAIHRVLPGLDTDRALRAAREVAAVEPVPDADPAALAGADAPALLLVSAGGDAHLVSGFDEGALERAMPDRSPDWRHLATAALHEVLMPLWDYPEERVRMVHEDPAEAAAAARSEKGTAVIVPPLHVDQVYAVADRGELTPRKSTSFGPKPRTGLVMRTLR
ncbi:hypothetical protein GCM10007079_29340 [Nocardiopsis terrae]|uniref:Uncharacterized protein (DUF1015 family) n=1 Tax=Nocardiopsis terrae TaxID=372655 RepID=A0ABR9HEK5_9ACTN|nr:DUF1015 domain-containing protein [Nocardiopsis terrae]MBE1457464.1 uncharacterized protein (DUF1015 family) [Nocardiopsis terrae]GHC86002.1 hypothetical protein GCM10007079_29340 [Nocardiopsis terrae]